MNTELAPLIEKGGSAEGRWGTGGLRLRLGKQRQAASGVGRGYGCLRTPT